MSSWKVCNNDRRFGLLTVNHVQDQEEAEYMRTSILRIKYSIYMSHDDWKNAQDALCEELTKAIVIERD